MSLSNRPKGYEPTAAGPPPTEPPPKPGVSDQQSAEVLLETMAHEANEMAEKQPDDVHQYAHRAAFAAAKAALAQQIETLRREREGLAKNYEQRQADAMRYAVEARAAEAEVERLREALREIADGKTALPHEQVALAALSPKEKP